jgi:predicted amidophosphoribosyltransferase
MLEENFLIGNDFCEKCGCQLDSLYSRYCEECIEEWADENEVYL